MTQTPIPATTSAPEAATLPDPVTSTTDTSTTIETVAPAPEAEPEFSAEYVRKLRQEAADARIRAKANEAAAARLAEIELASASDLDRAVAKAEADTRAQVAAEYGTRLARGIMLAGLSARIPAADADAILDDLNLTRYVLDDGTVDETAITATINRLAPPPVPPRIDLGQGGRGEGISIDQQIADAIKRGDSREAIRLTNSKLAQLPAPR
jgi:hypothetical protein